MDNKKENISLEKKKRGGKIKNFFKGIFVKLHNKFGNEKVDKFFLTIWKPIKKFFILLDNFFSKDGYIRGIIIMIVGAFIINLLVETLSRHSFFDAWGYLFTHPLSYLCNMLFILFTLAIGMNIRRRFFNLVWWGAIWIALGAVNGMILSNRVTPFNATDILMVKSGIDIADKYYSVGEIVGTAIEVIIIIIIIILIWVFGPKLKKKLNHVKAFFVMLAMMACCLLGIFGLVKSGAMATVFSYLPTAYKEYGFPYCFVSSFKMGVDKPDDYSEEKINEIIETSSNGNNLWDEKMEDTPNVIVIQLESFMDLNDLKEYEFDTNPIPNFTKLQENYPSGMIEVPSIGAGTSNTEFEILTGLNLDDFGPGEIPYKTIMLETPCENYSYLFKNNGYTTHALHDNDATFYQRHTVYPNFGFDTYTPMEYMNVKERTFMTWVKDKTLQPCIMDCLNYSEGQDFVYAVSVQGHGSYPETPVLDDVHVKCTKQPEGVTNYSMEYYANMMYEMDEFVGNLIDELKARDEKTVLVLYGDHLPTLNLDDNSVNCGNALLTPYVVWSNYDLDMEDDVECQAWQLMPMIMESVGLKSGTMNSYHQVYGKLYENGLITKEEYLSNLRNIAYDILYGEKYAYGKTMPFKTANTKFGIKDVVCTLDIHSTTMDEMEAFLETKVTKENDINMVREKYKDLIERHDKCFTIKGENFTDYSMVFIGDNHYTTRYIDENTIFFEGIDKLNPGDEIYVGQVGSDNYLLGVSNTVVYE